MQFSKKSYSLFCPLFKHAIICMTLWISISKGFHLEYLINQWRCDELCIQSKLRYISGLWDWLSSSQVALTGTMPTNVLSFTVLLIASIACEYKLHLCDICFFYCNPKAHLQVFSGVVFNTFITAFITLV